MHMNAVGKILVIFVFVFSLVATGLLLFSLTQSTDWSKKYEALEQNNAILAAEKTASSKTINNLTTKIALIEADREAKLKARDDELGKLKDDLKIAGVDLANEKVKVTEAQANQNTSTEDAKRYAVENKDLLAVIERREAEIVNLEKKHREINIALAQALGRAEAAIARALGQEERINQLEKSLLERDLARTSLTSIKDPNQPHPPAVSINGRITFVDGKDPSIIEVSLGTDHGLNKDNTLDVYRLDPRPEYLGMVKIMRADPHSSIGKMMRVAGIAPSPVRKGDSVSSDITRAK